MLRVGMIGLGVISRYYLAALEDMPGARLVAVCDRDAGKADRVPPAVEFCTDYHELIARADVDAVIVNLPNHLHAPVCREALLAGKHVCCEKPLAMSAADALDLEQLARQQDRTLFTAFHRRYNDHLVELAARLAPGSVSAVELSYLERIEDHCGDDSWYLDPASCGGGCVADNGPNAFDTLLHLLGPLRVRQCQVERDDRGVDRKAEVRLESTGGIPVTVHLDWSYPHGERKDVAVVHADGRTDRIDMLAGYPGFKSSLFHEYAGVLADFIRVTRDGRYEDTGRRVAELVDDAYSLAER